MSSMAPIPRSSDDLTVMRLLSDLEAARNPQVLAAPVPDDTDDPPPRPLREMLDELAEADPNRLPWPDDWFAHTDSGQIAACRGLWNSVLLSCIRSVFGALGVGEEQAGNKRLEASWIGSRDFHMVCALCGLDGVAVQSRLRRMASDPALIAALSGKATSNAKRVQSGD